LWTVFFLLAAPVCFSQTLAVDHKVAVRVKTPDDPFLNGAPFTFDQLLKLVRQDAIPLHRRKDAIASRGLDFPLTSDELDKLRTAGVSDDLLKLIKSKAKPEEVVPPPPPKPQPQGALAVTCEPAECDVSLNGTPLGSTKDGRIEMAKLRPGSWIVDVKKNGYISHQTTVSVDAGHTVPVSVVLEPDRATQEAFGAGLFRKVVQAVGGEEAVKELASVQASGSVVVGARDGRIVRWTLLMRNRPDRALFQIRAGGGILNEVAFVGSEYRTSKNLKGQEALDVPTDFGLIRDNQLSTLIAKLGNPQFKMVANHTTPVDGEEFTLFADDGSEKIAIGLDNDLLPRRVRVTSASGVGSNVVTYSDYSKSDKISYPKTLEIKPDGWQQGIEVRFDTVEVNPKLNENDYKLKGKALPNLGK